MPHDGGYEMDLAEKLWSVLSQRMATRLHSLSLRKNFSIERRHL